MSFNQLKEEQHHDYIHVDHNQLYSFTILYHITNNVLVLKAWNGVPV